MSVLHCLLFISFVFSVITCILFTYIHVLLNSMWFFFNSLPSMFSFLQFKFYSLVLLVWFFSDLFSFPCLFPLLLKISFTFYCCMGPVLFLFGIFFFNIWRKSVRSNLLLKNKVSHFLASLSLFTCVLFESST